VSDHLQQQWACLTCNSKFTAGEIVIPAGVNYGDPWPCPRCSGRNITLADGETRSTRVYYGEIGTRQ
jgi:NAD-dependent SIR2 family protein deacetylase